MQSVIRAPVAYARRRDRLMSRLLALLAIVWAGTWLVLVLVPSGDLGAADRGHHLMLLPFAAPGAGDLLQRLFEFVCLLPAAFFLVTAQAVQKRRRGPPR